MKADENGWKSVKSVKNCSKQFKMVENGWNCWKQIKTDENRLKKNNKQKTVEQGWKWLKTV